MGGGNGDLPRLPSSQAETSVLGAILLDNARLSEVADRLSPSAFFYPPYGRIFKCMQKIARERRPIDLVTLTEELRARRGLMP